MKRLSILTCTVISALAAGSASAQFIPPGGSALNPPLPLPPPPPRIEVPAIPKMDAPPSQPRVQFAPRGSFGDRISRCLSDGAAAGLNQADRAAYSRSCANQDQDLHVLMTVAQAGSMGKAALMLNTTQPNISRSIGKLERAFGVRLLDRRRRGIEPTERGCALLDCGAAVFDELR